MKLGASRMAVALFGNTLTDAWLADLDYLHSNGGEQLNLITTIGDPALDHLDGKIKAVLDEWLVREGKQRIDTVANTIFPEAYLRGCNDRQQLYERYQANLPRLRSLPKNGRGTYFGRLIEYPSTKNGKNGATTNQIEGIIHKLLTQLRSGRPKRYAYQAQIFAPGRDDNTTMGFPCMSYLSFQLDQSGLCLTAVYRNQYYFERALGNFVGLARLLQFVASEVGLEVGSLTVHACHAVIDCLGRSQAQQLLRACREIEPDAAAA